MSPRDYSMSARLAALRDEDIRASRGSLPCERDGLDLTDKDRTGTLDLPDERPGVAERQHDRCWLVVERQVEQLRLLRHTPRDKADAEACLGPLEQVEFPNKPAFIAIPTSQNAESASCGYRRGQPRVGHQIHRREKDRVRDPKELRYRRAERHATLRSPAGANHKILVAEMQPSPRIQSCSREQSR
jgi:hypothetical protein